jgi:DNA mismatch endonuclease (patch repair protein)
VARRQASRPDPLTPDQRRSNMSKIKGSDTRPEMIVRRGLHARGLRYRLHVRELPGTPDMVFGPARVVIFVHGCFWHGHDCPLGVRPRTNANFWDAKIQRNQERDHQAETALRAAGWRTASVWECALRGRSRLPLDDVLETLSEFIRSKTGATIEITGMIES